MIRSLKGTIEAVGDNNLVISVNNIGYLVNTPTARQTYLFGDEIFLHTHLAVRENSLDLYGFLEKNELTLFELLLGVPKIGPKSALQILSLADSSLLIDTIIHQDADRLHKMSGIGKKTAINLVSHLEEKITGLSDTTSYNTASAQLSQAQVDAIDALITLGYGLQEARTYVTKENTESDTKSIVQKVLKQIPIH
jgi:Holliday junction DNA helicase RuvA